MRFSKTISRYLVQAVVPYFALSWVLLTVILFVQQAGRFSDIFFNPNLPGIFVWQLTIALIPNVIAFTCPMAVLVGVIIGLSRMQSDNELVTIRAAGVGNLAIAIPIAILGVALSLFSFLVNLYGVPFAARAVRRVALQTAVYKLESPIEPGVFNTEVAGYTIYVKDGDITDGRWKNVFVHTEGAATSETRLITSSNGRIDFTGELSELVLENATVTTILTATGQEKLVSENIGEIRFAIKTRRGEMIERLSSTELAPEELGLSELQEFAEQRSGTERIEAQILRHRRLVMSLTPFIFSLLGTAMVLRFYRHGRGHGIFLALISLVSYYLLAFLGEQLARTGTVGVTAGSLIPVGASILAILVFAYAGRIGFLQHLTAKGRELLSGFRLNSSKTTRRDLFVDLTTGLRDFDLLRTVIGYYLLTLGFLAIIFMVFTAFELWRFAGSMDGGIWLLTKYLAFLLPFVYLQVAPSAAMVAILATFVIKSRQNEIITWTSAGQSIYRLLFPCLLLMLFLGIFNWQIQERIAPITNQVQDSLRLKLRNRGALANRLGKFWIANDYRIISFEPDSNASDNVQRIFDLCLSSCGLRNLSIYEFVDKGARLQTVYRISGAVWEKGRFRLTGKATKLEVGGEKMKVSELTEGEIIEPANPFLGVRRRPSHLNSAETRVQMDSSESDVERRSFAVALDKKYSTIFLPFVIALFTAPFALSLNRKGRVVTVGYAVGLWLIFMAATSGFEQMGINGTLPSGIAVWAPLVLFTMLGIYLLSKVKT